MFLPVPPCAIRLNDNEHLRVDRDQATSLSERSLCKTNSLNMKLLQQLYRTVHTFVYLYSINYLKTLFFSKECCLSWSRCWWLERFRGNRFSRTRSPPQILWGRSQPHERERVVQRTREEREEPQESVLAGSQSTLLHLRALRIRRPRWSPRTQSCAHLCTFDFRNFPYCRKLWIAVISVSIKAVFFSFEIKMSALCRREVSGRWTAQAPLSRRSEARKPAPGIN